MTHLVLSLFPVTAREKKNLKARLRRIAQKAKGTDFRAAGDRYERTTQTGGSGD